MAPLSRTASSSKRKAASDTDTDGGADSDSPPTRLTTSKSESHVTKSNSAAKRRKTAASKSESSLPAKQDQSNTGLSFAAKTPGTIRIATWNGFKHYLEAEDPDILVLTETKVNNPPVDPSLLTRFPHCYWSISAKKGYAGTAILSKYPALSSSTTIPGHPDPTSLKGRIITLEFPSLYLVGTYVVNAGEKLKTLSEKEEWNYWFTKYLRQLEKTGLDGTGKPVVWTGDLNVAPAELDLANAKKNWNKTAGYTESETSSYKRILDGSSLPLPPSQKSNDKAGEDEAETEAEAAPKFTDIWRQLHPEDRAYSYFSYRFNCRAKGLGWRLDMFVISERLSPRVKMCEIRGDVYGSDHVPLVMEIEKSGDDL
ncbi:hypothetical protein ONZ45_g3574 [Pleurotus djamor]|nr:hypothetical protein ONZ45_g3574 [Pleurotus djamor]